MSSALQGSSFDEFKSKFKGDLVFPSDSDYAAAIKRWALNAERRAAVVAFVRDAEDVSLAINFVRQTSPRLDLAIKGGGHSPAGSSSAEDGLIIDLSRYINYARVDPEKKVVHVGGGSVWKTVDDEANKYELATIAGTVNHTGVGGLTVGGGYGILTGEHGLAIDNLLQATVVVGDGRILSASETENPDLFFGIRGGGSNFGVVTEFVFKLHPQPSTIFMGKLVFAPPQLEALFETERRWRETDPSGKETMFIILTNGPPPNRHPCAIALLLYNGSIEDGKNAYKEFYGLGPIMDDSRVISYVESNELQNDFSAPGSCVYLKGALQAHMTRTPVHDLLGEIITSTQAPSIFEIAVIFVNHSMRKARQVAPDATAFINRSNDRNVMISVKYAPEHNTPENLAQARGIARRLFDTIVDAEGSEEAKDESRAKAYANYGDDTVVFSTEHAVKYFGSNFPRLSEIKKKYDPDLLFMKWFPISHPSA